MHLAEVIKARYACGMATSILETAATFIPTGALQPAYISPSSLVSLADTVSTQYQAGTVILAAGGTSYTLSRPASWSRITSVYISNQSLTGYAALTLNATTGAPVCLLAPRGGELALTHAGVVPAGTVQITPATWTLQSCDSAGVLANGVLTEVYVYLTGL